MKRLSFSLVALAVILILTPLASAEKKSSKWQGLKFINTVDLKQIYDAKDDFLLINALSPIEFAEMRIAKSVNIPFENMKDGTSKLPKNRDQKLIFYCKGPK